MRDPPSGQNNGAPTEGQRTFLRHFEAATPSTRGSHEACGSRDGCLWCSCFQEAGSWSKRRRKREFKSKRRRNDSNDNPTNGLVINNNYDEEFINKRQNRDEIFEYNYDSCNHQCQSTDTKKNHDEEHKQQRHDLDDMTGRSPIRSLSDFCSTYDDHDLSQNQHKYLRLEVFDFDANRHPKHPRPSANVTKHQRPTEKQPACLKLERSLLCKYRQQRSLTNKVTLTILALTILTLSLSDLEDVVVDYHALNHDVVGFASGGCDERIVGLGADSKCEGSPPAYGDIYYSNTNRVQEQIDFTNAQLEPNQLQQPAAQGYKARKNNNKFIYDHDRHDDDSSSSLLSVSLLRFREKNGDKRQEKEKEKEEEDEFVMNDNCIVQNDKIKARTQTRPTSKSKIISKYIARLLLTFLGLLRRGRAPLVMLASANSDANRLYEDLMMTYNKIVRPVQNESESVVVLLSLKLSQLIDVEWFDYKLKWDPSEYGGIQDINLPAEQIWLPDIVLYNSAEGTFAVSIMTKAKVRFDGHITWNPPAIFRSSCQINVAYFPFDYQDCHMKFGSWTFGDKIDLRHVNDTKGVIEHGTDLSEYYQNVEWDIMSAVAKRNRETYACCPDDVYIDVTFNFLLRRKPLFYTVNLILPCVGITILSFLVFYLPSDSGEKVTLTISILLSLIFFLSVLIETIPSTSLAMPLLGKYLVFTMVLITVSVCATVCVLNIHFRTPSTHAMPIKFKRWCVEILPKYLFVNVPQYQTNQQTYILPEQLVYTHNQAYLQRNEIAADRKLLESLQSNCKPTTISNQQSSSIGSASDHQMAAAAPSGPSAKLLAMQNNSKVHPTMANLQELDASKLQQMQESQQLATNSNTLFLPYLQSEAARRLQMQRSRSSEREQKSSISDQNQNQKFATLSDLNSASAKQHSAMIEMAAQEASMIANQDQAVQAERLPNNCRVSRSKTSLHKAGRSSSLFSWLFSGTSSRTDSASNQNQVLQQNNQVKRSTPKPHLQQDNTRAQSSSDQTPINSSNATNSILRNFLHHQESSSSVEPNDYQYHNHFQARASICSNNLWRVGPQRLSAVPVPPNYPTYYRPLVHLARFNNNNQHHDQNKNRFQHLAHQQNQDHLTAVSQQQQRRQSRISEISSSGEKHSQGQQAAANNCGSISVTLPPSMEPMSTSFMVTGARSQPVQLEALKPREEVTRAHDFDFDLDIDEDEDDDDDDDLGHAANYDSRTMSTSTQTPSPSPPPPLPALQQTSSSSAEAHSISQTNANAVRYATVCRNESENPASQLACNLIQENPHTHVQNFCSQQQHQQQSHNFPNGPQNGHNTTDNRDPNLSRQAVVLGGPANKFALQSQDNSINQQHLAYQSRYAATQNFGSQNPTARVYVMPRSLSSDPRGFQQHQIVPPLAPHVSAAGNDYHVQPGSRSIQSTTPSHVHAHPHLVHTQPIDLCDSSPTFQKMTRRSSSSMRNTQQQQHLQQQQDQGRNRSGSQTNHYQRQHPLHQHNQNPYNFMLQQPVFLHQNIQNHNPQQFEAYATLNQNHPFTIGRALGQAYMQRLRRQPTTQSVGHAGEPLQTNVSQSNWNLQQRQQQHPISIYLKSFDSQQQQQQQQVRNQFGDVPRKDELATLVRRSKSSTSLDRHRASMMPTTYDASNICDFCPTGAKPNPIPKLEHQQSKQQTGNLLSPKQLLHNQQQRYHQQQQNQKQKQAERLALAKLINEVDKAIQNAMFIAQHIDNLDEFESVKENWKYIAMVIDRIFLIVFLFACIVGTVTVFAGVPWYHYLYEKPIDLKLSHFNASLVSGQEMFPPDCKGSYS